jgi:S-adenosylmethionine:tRNA ribosyltransferase-isomerase
MNINDFDYNFPESSIAIHPPEVRGTSKLFVYFSQLDSIEIVTYNDLHQFLSKNDLLVRNKTEVFNARLHSKGYITNNDEVVSKEIEIFLLDSEHINFRQFLNSNYNKKIDGFFVKFLSKLKKEKVRNIKRIELESGWEINDIQFLHDHLSGYIKNSEWNELGLEEKITKFEDFLHKKGSTPIPPYLRRKEEDQDKSRYHTVFGNTKGSVAAPTASLNFTQELEGKLINNEVKMADVILHVGLGTFQTVREDHISNKKLHEETFYVPPETVNALRQAKAGFQRIIAIGTTTTRTLETIGNDLNSSSDFSGRTDIFIYAPYQFRLVDCLLTNFHYPRSSLLMLVDAFLKHKNATKNWKDIYEFAIKNNAKLFSYGDSMLIL